jgi:hypothetical protein
MAKSGSVWRNLLQRFGASEKRFRHLPKNALLRCEQLESRQLLSISLHWVGTEGMTRNSVGERPGRF